MPTLYDRFLDMHLVAPSWASAEARTGVGLGKYTQHNYDFAIEVLEKRRRYAKKYGHTGQNTKALYYVLGEKHVNANLQSGLAGEALDTMRYISCYVDIDSVRQKKRLIPDLEALVKWVSADTNEAGIPMKGKLRLNCHGDFKHNAGLVMGHSSISPDEMVDALIRHGLARRSPSDGDAQGGKLSYKFEPIANSAHWKADALVNACEKCRKSFSMVRRKHHCRRCGGIFCDACTKKRMRLKNPLTETGRATGTTDACRVCDDCFSKGSDKFTIKDVKRGIQADRGLVTIMLEMCLSARCEQDFATMAAGFARNSIADRLVKRLSTKGVHGIKVTGSNEIVSWRKGQLYGILGLEWPGRPASYLASPGWFDDPFAGILDADSGWLGKIGGLAQIRFPSSLLGTKPTAEYQPIVNQRIVPIHGGRAMAFGYYRANSPECSLVKRAFWRWKFNSWRVSWDVPYSPGKDVNRLATQLDPAANGGLATQQCPFGVGEQLFTVVLDAPQRNITIQKDPANPDTQLIMSDIGNQKFKDHKIFAIT